MTALVTTGADLPVAACDATRDMPCDLGTRRPRERVVDDQGLVRVQVKQSRADVLCYPAHDLVTVLIRRTHDVARARAMAEERWAELRAEGLVDEDLGVDPDRSMRVGWWTTKPGRQRHSWQAVDQRGRVVTPCSSAVRSAGPGVEFRP